jgi:putative tricarboxylic transport membrane protein
LSDIFAGLDLAVSPTALALMAVGVVLSTLIVAMPGLGGGFVQVLLLPIAVVLEPSLGLALFLAADVVSGTGNVFSSVLFGVPGSSMGVATVFDGYPMAQKGQARRALGAAFTSSAVGGLIGAMALAALIPVTRPIVLAMGPPEFFVLLLTAVLFMGYVGKGDTLKAFVVGGLGFLLSFIGQEPSTASLRFTFDVVYLFDGIQLLPFLIGLYAISEMMTLLLQRGSIAQQAADPGQGLWRGIKDVFVYWKTTIRSSVVGVIIGIIPGLGGETAQFLAYSQEAKVSKERDQFGKGAVQGVIASDACTNSKDGGALLPTLLLGIPGSSGMAVTLVFLIAIGIQPGPEMLGVNAPFLWQMVWVLVIANLMATAFCLSLSKPMARVTGVRASLVVAPVLCLAILGSYASTFSVGDIFTAVFFGIVGYFMNKHGYSRATLVIGFVLGQLLEKNYLLTTRLFGWEFLVRPGVLIITGLVLALFVVPPLLKRFRPKGPSPEEVLTQQLTKRAQEAAPPSSNSKSGG